MKRDYFAKSEQIYKGGRAMIIMDIKVDNIYAFKDVISKENSEFDYRK